MIHSVCLCNSTNSNKFCLILDIESVLSICKRTCSSCECKICSPIWEIVCVYVCVANAKSNSHQFDLVTLNAIATVVYRQCNSVDFVCISVHGIISFWLYYGSSLTFYRLISTCLTIPLADSHFCAELSRPQCVASFLNELNRNELWTCTGNKDLEETKQKTHSNRILILSTKNKRTFCNVYICNESIPLTWILILSFNLIVLTIWTLS